jgi:hypothetical protein
MFKVFSGDPNPKKVVHVCDQGGKTLAVIPHKGLEVEDKELADKLVKLGYQVSEVSDPVVGEDAAPADDGKKGKGKGK